MRITDSRQNMERGNKIQNGDINTIEMMKQAIKKVIMIIYRDQGSGEKIMTQKIIKTQKKNIRREKEKMMIKRICKNSK